MITWRVQREVWDVTPLWLVQGNLFHWIMCTVSFHRDEQYMLPRLSDCVSGQKAVKNLLWLQLWSWYQAVLGFLSSRPLSCVHMSSFQVFQAVAPLQEPDFFHSGLGNLPKSSQVPNMHIFTLWNWIEPLEEIHIHSEHPGLKYSHRLRSCKVEKRNSTSLPLKFINLADILHSCIHLIYVYILCYILFTESRCIWGCIKMVDSPGSKSKVSLPNNFYSTILWLCGVAQILSAVEEEWSLCLELHCSHSSHSWYVCICDCHIIDLARSQFWFSLQICTVGWVQEEGWRFFSVCARLSDTWSIDSTLFNLLHWRDTLLLQQPSGDNTSHSYHMGC